MCTWRLIFFVVSLFLTDVSVKASSSVTGADHLICEGLFDADSRGRQCRIHRDLYHASLGCEYQQKKKYFMKKPIKVT